jgi:hypothetical protein
MKVVIELMFIAKKPPGRNQEADGHHAYGANRG